MLSGLEVSDIVKKIQDLLDGKNLEDCITIIGEVSDSLQGKCTFNK